MKGQFRAGAKWMQMSSAIEQFVTRKLRDEPGAPVIRATIEEMLEARKMEKVTAVTPAALVPPPVGPATAGAPEPTQQQTVSAHYDPRAHKNALSRAWRVRVWGERRAKGLCPSCGERPPAENRKYCRTCLDKYKWYEQQRQLRRRAKGGSVQINDKQGEGKGMEQVAAIRLGDHIFAESDYVDVVYVNKVLGVPSSVTRRLIQAKKVDGYQAETAGVAGALERGRYKVKAGDVLKIPALWDEWKNSPRTQAARASGLGSSQTRLAKVEGRLNELSPKIDRILTIMEQLSK